MCFLIFTFIYFFTEVLLPNCVSLRMTISDSTSKQECADAEIQLREHLVKGDEAYARYTLYAVLAAHTVCCSMHTGIMTRNAHAHARAHTKHMCAHSCCTLPQSLSPPPIPPRTQGKVGKKWMLMQTEAQGWLLLFWVGCVCHMGV